MVTMAGLRLLFLLGLLVLRPGPAEAALFGSSEVRRGAPTVFAKWIDMLARPGNEAGPNPAAGAARLVGSGDCVPNPRFACARMSVDQVLGQIARGDQRALLARVNALLNDTRYLTDLENYGVSDYWATVFQFLRRDGDCEDYAIAKYMVLKRMGFTTDQLRVVVVQDLNLGVPHAILAVYVDGAAYILDNQIQQVMSDRAIAHYRPIYSINETAWWLHKPVN